MSQAANLMDGAVSDTSDLSARLALLTRWGYLTKKQSATLAQLVSAQLPCSLSVSKRSTHGSVYVRANCGQDESLAFRLDPNARVYLFAGA